MEKRYQVFISSTMKDLAGARQEVSQALLRADCFPAGMELFPATNEEQFDFIKSVIDQSDYYIVISAGWYGSIYEESGLSYTEMEYDYACTCGKPIIRLLHGDPFNDLPGEKIESSEDRRRKLEAFREKMSQSHLVRYWRDAKELNAETLFGLIDVKKRYPSAGWIHGDKVLTKDREHDLISKINDLKVELEQTKEATLSESVGLAQGLDQFTFQYTTHIFNNSLDWDERKETEIKGREQVCVSWDEICAALLPSMQSEADERTLDSMLDHFVLSRTKESALNLANKGRDWFDTMYVSVDRADFAQIIVQLRALRFIEPSIKKRGLRDTGNYWTLTARGEAKLIEVLAIKREKSAGIDSSHSARY